MLGRPYHILGCDAATHCYIMTKGLKPPPLMDFRPPSPPPVRYNRFLRQNNYCT